MSNCRILVLGSGNFGTALALHLSKKGEDVTILTRHDMVARSINENHVNPKYLSQISLPANLKAISSEQSADLNTFGMIVLAVPTQFLRTSLESIADTINEDAIIVCASKGIEIGTLQFPMTIVEEVLPQINSKQLSILSGPSFAIEVAQAAPTSVSIASIDESTSKTVQKTFHTKNFRAYTSNDPMGLEVAGALKNVVALASGATKGMGMENNAWAALLTRGLAEITRVGMALGCSPVTFSGLGGVGDLFLTCTSEKSRNFRVGFGIGKGQDFVDVIKNLGSVAEGVTTAKSAYQLSQRLKVDTPIINTVYSVIYEKKPLQIAVAELLEREMKPEITYP